MSRQIGIQILAQVSDSTPNLDKAWATFPASPRAEGRRAHPDIGGGFFLCHWDGTAETEAKIKEDTQATIRCVPFDYEQTPGVDMVTGKPSKCRVLIARSY